MEGEEHRVAVDSAKVGGVEVGKPSEPAIPVHTGENTGHGGPF